MWNSETVWLSRVERRAECIFNNNLRWNIKRQHIKTLFLKKNKSNWPCKCVYLAHTTTNTTENMISRRKCKQYYYLLRFLEFIVYFYYEYQQRRWLNGDFFSTATTDSNSFTPFIMVFRIILLLSWHFSIFLSFFFVSFWFFAFQSLALVWPNVWFVENHIAMEYCWCVICMIINHSEQYQLFRCIVHLIDIFLGRFFSSFREPQPKATTMDDFILNSGCMKTENHSKKMMQCTMCSPMKWSHE